jgi:16S rRNA (guanine(966)-N(2))-methyltransferase RsmD
MSIRVIAGSARGRPLKLVPGDTTRPIMDRVKESLFNIIGRAILDATFCDLFAGTGSVGIEALSRGAAHCTFIDIEPKAIETIRANLKATRLEDKATVRKADVYALLRQPSAAYDFVYIAPPQYKGMWLETLNLLEQAEGWLAMGSQVIVQIDPKERADTTLKRMKLADERLYGSTLLLFFEVTE